MKRLFALSLAATFCAAALVGCGGSKAEQPSAAAPAAAEVNPLVGERFENTVRITLMNSKGEIADGLEKGAALFGSAYNVNIEIFEAETSPGLTISQRYASGDPPTIAIVDINQVQDLAGERIADLTDEPWVAVGGDAMGLYVNGRLYGMPFAIEGRCLLYNKTAIENTLGRAINPDDYVTLDDFKSLVEELVTSGMETPFAVNAEDWSVGQHLLQYIYEYQDGTIEGGISFLKNVHDGKTTFIENGAFNRVFDAFDLFFAYNINRDDPLAADYDLNASYFADGTVAFWVNGTWAWPNIAPYEDDSMEYGVFHFPINDAATQGKVIAGATKYITLDIEHATDEQLKAAKMFLNWLIFDPVGQSVLVNDCQVLTAFTNIELLPTNPLDAGLRSYINAGRTVAHNTYAPTDHRTLLAPSMQAYLGGRIAREALAAALDDYWRSHLPVE